MMKVSSFRCAQNRHESGERSFLTFSHFKISINYYPASEYVRADFSFSSLRAFSNPSSPRKCISSFLIFTPPPSNSSKMKFVPSFKASRIERMEIINYIDPLNVRSMSANCELRLNSPRFFKADPPVRSKKQRFIYRA